MAKDPAFLFYSSDFLSGISDLTMEERGQYITLLCLQHQKGNLSQKTISLSVGLVSVDVLKKFDKDSEGNYFNKRLLEETEKRNKFTESRRLNGLQGGRGKSKDLEDKANAKAKENLMEDENVNENIIEDTNEGEKEKKSKSERKNLIFPYTSDTFMNTWNAMLGLSKWKRKQFVSLQASLNKLSNYPEPIAVQTMLNTIEGNWMGLFPEKVTLKTDSNTPQTNKFAANDAAAQEILIKLQNEENHD